MIRWSAVLTLLAAGVVRADEPLKVGDPAPDFSLLNAENMTVRLGTFRDRQPVVLVFCQAEWSPSCLAYVKALQTKYPEFKKAGAEVVAVFREDSGRVDSLKRIRESTKAEFVLLSDYESQRTKPYSTDGVTAYVIDRMGLVRTIVTGTKAARPDIDKLLDAVKMLK